MKKTTGFYPRPSVDTRGRAAVGQAGGVLLTSTVKAAGLDAGLSAALAPWWPAGATHDPAKLLLDLALTLALGGDTCSDLAVVRAELRRRSTLPVPAPPKRGVIGAPDLICRGQGRGRSMNRHRRASVVLRPRWTPTVCRGSRRSAPTACASEHGAWWRPEA